MNRRNIIAGSRTVRLIRTPAALIYHAVLCCIFAVSLSIIHETQIPFTFFGIFEKSFRSPLSLASSTAGVKPLSHGLRRDSSLVGEPLAGRRVFGVWRFAPVCPADATLFLPCGRRCPWSASIQIEKMNLMPRPPLLGEVASSVSDDDGEVLHQKAPPSLKGAMGALCHITMGSAYSALGASGAFASSAFAAGSAGAAGAAAGFGACFTTGLGGFGSSFSGKRMMCLGHF